MLLNFDYDGVLADSFDMLLDIAKAAQARIGHGRQPTGRDLATIENLTFKELAILIGIPYELSDQFEEEVLSLQLQATSYPRFFDDIVPVFRQLAETHTVTIITSSKSTWVGEALEKNGLRNSIATIMGGELKMTKAQRIQKAQALYGFDADSTVMLGDAISDIRQGKLANVKTGAILWGFQEAKLLRAESPTYELYRPRDLLTLFAG